MKNSTEGQFKMQGNLWRAITFLGISCTFLLLAGNDVLAQNLYDELQKVECAMLEAISRYQTFAVIFCMVITMGVGVGSLFGRFNWKWLWVSLGATLVILLAPAIIELFAPGYRSGCNTFTPLDIFT